MKTLKEKLRQYRESTESFVIPANISSNYETPGGLDNVQNWKAKVYLNNNGTGKTKVGDMDKVGYIAVDPTSSNIIPIARADEHHNGMDLIGHLISKKIIPKEAYITLWPHSTSYVYGHQSAKYMQDTIAAYKKWLAYGGKDIPLTGYNGILYHGTLSDFIKRVKSINTQGVIVLDNSTITPTGARFLKDLHDLASRYRKILDAQGTITVGSDRVEVNLAKDAYAFIKATFSYGETYPRNLLQDYKLETKLEADADTYQDNLQKLMEIINGFPGIKNHIHTNLKRILSIKGTTTDRELMNIRDAYTTAFGNIKKAEAEMTKIGGL